MQIDWMVVLLLVFMAVQTIVNFSQGRRLRKQRKALLRAIDEACNQMHDVITKQTKERVASIELGIAEARKATSYTTIFEIAVLEDYIRGQGKKFAALEKHLGIELTTEPAKPEKQFYRETRKKS